MSQGVTWVILPLFGWLLCPRERKFSFEFKCRYFANGKFVKFKFTNLSMMAYTLENQQQKFANIQFRDIDNYEPGC